MKRYKLTLDDGRKITIEAETPEEAAQFGEQWASANPAKSTAKLKRPTALGGLGYQPEEEASRQAFRQGAANVAVPRDEPVKPPSRIQAAASQFAQSATLGQAPNIFAARSALTGGSFPEAKAFYQQRLMQGAEKFPVTTGAADIAGFLAPGGAVLKGATTLARPVTRAVQTAPAIVRGGSKVLGGAALGATEGALYGSTVQAERQAMEQGQATPTMQQRGEAAVPAAAMGAVVGGALPIVGKALAPVGTAIAGQAVKAFGPGATARQAERVAQKAVRADLQRAGINNLDDFLRAAEQYQGKPAMTGEIAQSTLNTLTALVRGKGTTGDKVQAILADRVAGFPARMMQDLEAATGLKAEEILGDIDAMVKAGRETATPQYDIAKAAPFKVSEKLQSLIDRSPTVQQAVEAARSVIADKAAAAGKSVDEIPPLEFYDEVKQQIDRIEFSGRKMGDRETRQIDEVRRAFVQALDEIVPGAYAQARKAGGEAPKIREAVKLGQNSYTKPLEQVVSDIAGMGEPALKAYRGAFVTNLVNKIRMGQLKPAALRSPNLRDKMATLFGEDAADQLVTKFSQEFDLLKKGSRLDPNVGSVTSQALLGAPDQALDDLLNAGSAAVEFAQNLARGNLFGMGGQILNYFRRAGYTEAQLNAIGDLLASDPQRAARILFPNEMARLGATPGGATATNVLANPTRPRSGGANTLAMPPEVGGAFVGGALGATQGETPEERARNALLGAAGGAVGGRMARGMTPDRTRMGSNLGNVPKPVQKAQAEDFGGKGKPSTFIASTKATKPMATEFPNVTITPAKETQIPRGYGQRGSVTTKNGKGRIEFSLTKRGDIRVLTSELPVEARGKGLGVEMYEALAQYASRNRKALYSDSIVSGDAVKIYMALKRRGYNVRLANPEGTFENPNFRPSTWNAEKHVLFPVGSTAESGAGSLPKESNWGSSAFKVTKYAIPALATGGSLMVIVEPAKAQVGNPRRPDGTIKGQSVFVENGSPEQKKPPGQRPRG